MVRERPGFNHKAVLIMSIVLLASGVLSIIFGGVQIGIRSQIGYIGYGIWCGLIITTTGIIGVLAWRYKNNCTIVGLMVMCIITSVFGFVFLGLAATSLGIDVSNQNYRRWRSYDYNPYWSWSVSAIWLESLLIIISLLVIVTSIVLSAYCCKAVCCGTPRQPGTIVGYAPNQQQVIIGQPGNYPGQQVMFAPAQTMPQQYITQGYVQGQPVMVAMRTPQGQMMMTPAQGQMTMTPAQGQMMMTPAQGQMIVTPGGYIQQPMTQTPQPTQAGNPTGGAVNQTQPVSQTLHAGNQPQATAEAPPVYSTLDNKNEGNYNYTQLQE